MAQKFLICQFRVILFYTRMNTRFRLSAGRSYNYHAIQRKDKSD